MLMIEDFETKARIRKRKWKKKKVKLCRDAQRKNNRNYIFQ